MANIKNLSRLGQISEELPRLEQARTVLSGEWAEIYVTRYGDETSRIALPPDMRLHVVNALNLKINALKEELQKL